jgi:hypothetical protein
MAILIHGTTRQRGERIAAEGPDPDYLEPGGLARAEGFSTCLESGPFPLGMPEQYACSKALAFPDEGGAAILSMDVPDEIVALAVTEYFPLSQGLVQFDPVQDSKNCGQRGPRWRNRFERYSAHE